MSAPNAPPCLFLSHSGADIDVARELKRRLLNNSDARAAGLRVWLDKDDLVAGVGWQAQLEKVISQDATAFGVHLGANGVVNWVESEVRLALSRAESELDYCFIPIFSKEPLPGATRAYTIPSMIRRNSPSCFKLYCGDRPSRSPSCLK